MADEDKKTEDKTFTQDEVNEIVGKEKAKVKSKFSKYNEYKEQAQKLEEMQNEVEELKSQLDGKDKEFIGVENELKGLRHEKEVSDWKKSISKETGVPVDVLRGDSEEEIQSHADQLKAVIGFPKVDRGENPKGKGFSKEESVEDSIANKLSEAVESIV